MFSLEKRKMQENITSVFRYLKGHYTEDRAEWFKVLPENWGEAQ